MSEETLDFLSYAAHNAVWAIGAGVAATMCFRAASRSRWFRRAGILFAIMLAHVVLNLLPDVSAAIPESVHSLLWTAYVPLAIIFLLLGIRDLLRRIDDLYREIGWLEEDLELRQRPENPA